MELAGEHLNDLAPYSDADSQIEDGLC